MTYYLFLKQQYEESNYKQVSEETKNYIVGISYNLSEGELDIIYDLTKR